MNAREATKEGCASGRTSRGARAVLAIEISTSDGQIAVLRGDDVLYSVRFASQRSHNAQMFAPLGEALAAAGDDLGLIVVGTGPGSYTGVRIAIAAAHGISLSRGVTVVGIPSVLVPRDAPVAGEFGFVGDARRGSCYVARIKDGENVESIRILPPDELPSWLDAMGSIPVFTFEEGVADSNRIRLSSPSAESLARHALRMTDEQIADQAARPIEPVYVREAFITTPKRPWLQV